jgi:hypothetical protein
MVSPERVKNLMRRGVVEKIAAIQIILAILQCREGRPPSYQTGVGQAGFKPASDLSVEFGTSLSDLLAGVFRRSRK